MSSFLKFPNLAESLKRSDPTDTFNPEFVLFFMTGILQSLVCFTLKILHKNTFFKNRKY